MNTRNILAVFHNLIDVHLFIKGHQCDTGVNAEETEKYLSFNFKINIKLIGVTIKDGNYLFTRKNIQPRFMDSFRFMVSSLDKLTPNLDDYQCKSLREVYKEDGVFKLMRRKGVFPYEYMNSWQKVEAKKLPPKKAF